ncbi:Wzz/FepE/Etk N-terminal domain-containing protein [Roseateles noduli]|uniref:Wzz/FepE/Etk N-terminal domain-containing protein n=1 Tax=Roseateles noduli TaxID=2052484 RepID=UPI003D657A93
MDATPGGQEIQLRDLVSLFSSRWRLLAGGSILAGALGYGLSFVVAPTFTARTLFLPPQPQQQSAAASALASLGALAGLAGGGTKTTADQYVALMQSVNVEDRIIDRFKLLDVYEVKFRELARKRLESSVRITVGKKDGLIALEADAPSAEMAAAMANQYVDELRRLTGELALSEAKQRRMFFETELARTRTHLNDAQLALQRSGFNPGALRTEPKAAADAYARLKAELTAAEVRLQTMRRSLSDGSSELLQQDALVGALRGQLRQLEVSGQDGQNNVDYVSSYREFKYQEALFELFSKQYELARLDESKEGTLIQVVDVASPPERRSSPRRSVFTLVGALSTLFLLAVGIFARDQWLRAQRESGQAIRQQRD